jgi:tetratricopeptide (TPR) repeat protein
MVGRIILITSFLLSIAFLSQGCSGSTARLDRSELESAAAQKASEFVKAGQPDKAAEVLKEAIESGPRMARLHLELGVILHESLKDYLGAAYHYRKYLELRTDTQKRALIENRIKAALKLLAAGLAGTESAEVPEKLRELEKENGELIARNLKLEEDLRAAQPLLREAAMHSEGASAVSGAAVPSAVQDGGGVRTYAVQPGDSLSSIAMKFYKDGERWKQIYEANRKELENSNDLRIGQVLIIP